MSRGQMPRHRRRVLMRIVQDVTVGLLCAAMGIAMALRGGDAYGYVAGALLLSCALIFARDARRAWLVDGRALKARR